MEPRYQEIRDRPSVEKIEPKPPRPRYVLWVSGGRALVDGEFLVLTEVEKYLIYNDECISTFNLDVASPEMAIAIAKRITGCSMLGLVELEDDGEYYEWYDDQGRDLEELSEKTDESEAN
tara:strand:- start:5160 stop:5519 length:360 start_codon:yes stop_codon:yes gene_type:complete